MERGTSSVILDWQTNMVEHSVVGKSLRRTPVAGSRTTAHGADVRVLPTRLSSTVPLEWRTQRDGLRCAASRRNRMKYGLRGAALALPATLAVLSCACSSASSNPGDGGTAGEANTGTTFTEVYSTIIAPSCTN